MYFLPSVTSTRTSSSRSTRSADRMRRFAISNLASRHMLPSSTRAPLLLELLPLSPLSCFLPTRTCTIANAFLFFPPPHQQMTPLVPLLISSWMLSATTQSLLFSANVIVPGTANHLLDRILQTRQAVRRPLSHEGILVARKDGRGYILSILPIWKPRRATGLATEKDIGHPITV